MNAIHESLYTVFHETLSKIYETVVADPDSPLTLSDLAEVVRKEHAELATLRALSASRAGDTATVLAENAALVAACEAAEALIAIMQRPIIMDYDEETCGLCQYRNEAHADDCQYPLRYSAYIDTRAALSASRAGDMVTLITALEEIRANYGKVCNEYETCDHPACASSYGAWAVADEALRGVTIGVKTP